MQSFLSRFFRRAPLGHVAALLALGGLLAACDRHSAAEVPENYGHGSSHQRSYTDHGIDSHLDGDRQSHSFSDTQGMEAEKEGKSATAEKPAASPSGTAAGHFFPAGS